MITRLPHLGLLSERLVDVAWFMSNDESREVPSDS